MRVRCGDAQEHAFPKTQAPRHPLWCRGALSLLDLVKQLAVHSDLAAQQIYLRVSSFDQPDKLSNHACAFASKGCESLVLICETSAGSGVTGSLDVLGCCSAQLLLQACNAGSVSSAAMLCIVGGGVLAGFNSGAVNRLTHQRYRTTAREVAASRSDKA